MSYPHTSWWCSWRVQGSNVNIQTIPVATRFQSLWLKHHGLNHKKTQRKKKWIKITLHIIRDIFTAVIFCQSQTTSVSRVSDILLLTDYRVSGVNRSDQSSECSYMTRRSCQHLWSIPSRSPTTACISCRYHEHRQLSIPSNTHRQTQTYTVVQKNVTPFTSAITQLNPDEFG